MTTLVKILILGHAMEYLLKGRTNLIRPQIGQGGDAGYLGRKAAYPEDDPATRVIGHATLSAVSTDQQSGQPFASSARKISCVS